MLNRSKTEVIQVRSLLQIRTFTHQPAQLVPETGVMMTHCVDASVSGQEQRSSTYLCFLKEFMLQQL